MNKTLHCSLDNSTGFGSTCVLDSDLLTVQLLNSWDLMTSTLQPEFPGMCYSRLRWQQNEAVTLLRRAQQNVLIKSDRILAFARAFPLSSVSVLLLNQRNIDKNGFQAQAQEIRSPDLRMYDL